MSADSKKYFLILLVLYFLVRIPLLFSNQLLSDELDIGAIANELVTKGLHLPVSILDYQKRPYAMTSLLDAAFAAPFFLLFGSTLFSLKLASLVWYLFPLIAWFYVWQNTFSPQKAFFILLFFVLSPEMVFYSLTYGHQHLETMLWMALSLIFFRQFLLGKFGEVSGGLLLGLFGGFICSLSLANGVALALLSLPLLRRPVFLGVALLSFLVGISPLILYNIKYNVMGYFAMQEIFTRMDSSLSHFFQRGLWTFGKGIPGLFVFKNFSPTPKFILTGFFTLTYLVSYLHLVWEKRKSLLCFQSDKGFDLVAFGVTYQALFIALALASNRIYGKELLFPIVPFIGMTLVMGASRFSQKWIKTCLVLFCITVWILGDLSLVRIKKWGEAFHIQGYSYTLLAQQLGGKFYLNKNFTIFQKKLRIFLEGHTAGNKRQLAFASLGLLPIEQTASHEFLYSILEAEEIIQPIFYEHFGRSLGKISPANIQLQDYQNMIRLHPEIYRGWISVLSGPNLIAALKKGRSLCIRASPHLKPACYEGLGLLGSPDSISIDWELEEEYRSFYLLGLGRHTTLKWLGGSYTSFQPSGLINQLEKEEWNRFDFSTFLSKEEKQWLNRGIEAESFLLVEDAFLREKILKTLLL